MSEATSAAVAADRDIAVIGMACRFPGGVNTPEDLWRLSLAETDAVGEVPESRWRRADLYSSDPAQAGKISTKWAGCIEDIDRFDAGFFRIAPHEAAQIDPQQRLLLETAHEALEAAGAPRHSARVSGCGVFVGISGSDYGRLLGRNLTAIDAHFNTGQASSIAANRLSYVFGMTGPSMAVDTACSSSLVAVHLAVQSLRAGDCQLALAAGVNVVLAPDQWVSASKAGMMSPTGRCRSFGAEADGFVRSDGCGVLVLKPLALAEADGDHVLGVIRGTAVNQDGRSNGLTAPNGPAQEAVIRAALADAGIGPERVGHVEAHGSGTPLGDPIEISALAATYGRSKPDTTPCMVSSVKSNLGHTEAAAGMAGMIRLLLCLREGQVPATLHTRDLNPRLSLAGTRLVIAQQTQPWPAEQPRVGAVSSFGFGGTNAHIVVQQAAPAPRRAVTRQPGPLVLPLSAADDEPLRALAARYLPVLDAAAGDPERIGDLCYSVAAGRSHGPARAAFTAEDPAGLREQLKAFSSGGEAPHIHPGAGVAPWRDTVFVFSGQGQELTGAGTALLAEPRFAVHARRCAEVFDGPLGVSILDLLTQEGAEAERLLERTDVAQAVLFTVQSGLFLLWTGFGLAPAAVVGHSAGESAAAYAAGLLNFDAATELVLARGTAMQTAGDGRMVAVSAPSETVAPFLEKYSGTVVIAVENAPLSVVVSGPAEPVAELTHELGRAGHRCKPLPGHFAFHSPSMAAAGEVLGRSGAGAATGSSTVPLFSSVTGSLLDGTRLDTAHWAQGVLGRVRFQEAVQEAVHWGFSAFLEIGPRPTLRGPVRASAAQAGTKAQVVHAAVPDDDRLAGPRGVLPALYVRGADIDWQAVYEGGRFLPGMPAYPWQRRRYWALDAVPHPTAGAESRTAAEPSSLSHQTDRRNTMSAGHDWAVDEIAGELARVLDYPRQNIAEDSRFLDLGADSILLLRLVTAVNGRHDTAFKASDLFEKYSSVGELAAALAETAGPKDHAVRGDHQPQPVLPQPVTSAAADWQRPADAGIPVASSAESVVREQLDVMRQQLALINRSQQVSEPVGGSLVAGAPAQGGTTLAPAPAALAGPAPQRALAAAPSQAKPVADALTPGQQEYVEVLTRRLEERSPQSKKLAGQYRQYLVESRPWGNFRPELKELNFPLTVDRARGSRFWDADGTEYTDYCLGFGVHFLGHNPSFVEEAVAGQVRRSFSLGPQQELTYRVAEQFCRVTGHDRVSFTNTGSEAVMGAVRLARLATGRPKVVYFEKSYHGITDGMLGRAGATVGSADAIAPGLSEGALGDVIILPYDDQSALDYIEAHRHEIAAVLVEPVQARNPVTQPVEFLQRLRRLTTTTGIVLIFDEMITGFRMGIRGAQGLFGIKPDLATYGKVLGGGLAIAAIAGRKDLMDGLDGGAWTYGDDSAPYAQTTLFGGTFQKHPLSIAAAGAVLTHLEEHGERLYREVNDRAARLTTALSDLFAERQLPYTVARFGSLWRFQYGGLANLYQPLSLEMLYHSLLSEGLYVWEGRTFFLSTEHTDSDAERFLDSVSRNLDALHRAGFLTQGGSTSRRTQPALPKSDASSEPDRWLMSAHQRELWELCRGSGPESVAYNETVVLAFQGDIDTGALRSALSTVCRRHPALRSVCTPDGTHLVVTETPKLAMRSVDAPDDVSADAATRDFADAPFDLTAGPLFRTMLLRRGEDRADLVLSAHHLVFDGTSITTVLADLAAAYELAVGGADPVGEAVIQQPGTLATDGEAPAELVAYWRKRLDRLPAPVWEPGAGAAVADGDSGPPARQAFRLEQDVWDALTARCPSLRCTPFMVAFSAFTAALHKLSGRDDLVVSVPVDQRPGERQQHWVGHFVTYVPVRSRNIGTDFLKHHKRTSRALTEDLGNAGVPLHTMLDALEQQGALTDAWAAREELTSVVFDLNPAVPAVDLGGARGEISLPAVKEAKFDLFFDVIPVDGAVHVDVIHRAHVTAEDVQQLWKHWHELIRQVAFGKTKG
ncbi:aminotransferase class III-fold pyridoxal phosphate-dependent enzyme [Streptomyces sp. NPDC006539]|uniref:aminotransferase class III-fold pyridoxal phosphate-dependent enzyme n=1 Tax=Streptomyces sp. NPDC006539 TaxID=3155352 RepID=UPI0033B8EA19